MKKIPQKKKPAFRRKSADADGGATTSGQRKKRREAEGGVPRRSDRRGSGGERGKDGSDGRTNVFDASGRGRQSFVRETGKREPGKRRVRTAEREKRVGQSGGNGRVFGRGNGRRARGSVEAGSKDSFGEMQTGLEEGGDAQDGQDRANRRDFQARTTQKQNSFATIKRTWQSREKKELTRRSRAQNGGDGRDGREGQRAEDGQDGQDGEGSAGRRAEQRGFFNSDFGESADEEFELKKTDKIKKLFERSILKQNSLIGRLGAKRKSNAKFGLRKREERRRKRGARKNGKGQRGSDGVVFGANSPLRSL